MTAGTVKRAAAVDPERQLTSFIDKFSEADQRLIRSVRRAVRRRLPTANELVWDNYNFLVIGYSATDQPSDSILSIAARANGLGLCFIHGASLPDPGGILSGSGSQTRFLRLDSAAALRRAEVAALVDAAVARSKEPFPPRGRGRLIVRSVAARQRPRRKPIR